MNGFLSWPAERWWSTGTGVTPGVDSLSSAMGLADLQKDLWPLKLELQSLAIWTWVFDQRLHPTGFLEESEIKHLSSDTLDPAFQMVSHSVFSASRAHYLQDRNEENYQRPFYSKENEISFARLAVIFSFCLLLKRHAREIILHSFFHLRLCLVLPFSYRSFDQRILIALSYYFYFLQEVYNYIKLDCSFPGECFLY